MSSEENVKIEFSWSCPREDYGGNKILLAHGGGGSLMHRLIKNVFEKYFANPFLKQHHDSAIIELDGVKIAFTTDSFVVKPIFFPGGDIGKLAVCGTLNDLAVAGACPLYLSAGFILEEGLEIQILEKIVSSMKMEADFAGVNIVTGDTKVIDQKSGDGLYINTTGIGVVKFENPPSPKNIRVGDHILLSGDIGRHGIAVLSARENITFEPVIESDCMNIAPAVLSLYEAGVKAHCLRDCTRGGLASALNELAEDSQLSFVVEESKIPIREEIRGACEILGLNPLYVANEGRFVAFIPEEDVPLALDVLRNLYPDLQASDIGRVTEKQNAPVILRNYVGIETPLPMLSGEQLPRIC